MPLRNNVAIPSGDIYPNGVTPTVAPGDIQATVRPAGTLFRQSAGYATIRPGKSEFQDANHGLGIHFTPQRYAEDVGNITDAEGYPLMVDKARAVDMTDIADLPGSERLDDDGTITPYEAGANKGVMLSDSSRFPTGSADIRESERTLPDMGDRNPGRPLTRATHGIFHNPVRVLRADWQENPLMAVFAASFVVGVAYLVIDSLENQFRGRSGGGATGSAGAAAAAPVAATGDVTTKVTGAVAESVESIGTAVKDVTDAAADAVKSD